MSVRCSLCSVPLPEPSPESAPVLAQREWYKFGELKYIELAHRHCVLRLAPAEQHAYNFDRHIVVVDISLCLACSSAEEPDALPYYDDHVCPEWELAVVA